VYLVVHHANVLWLLAAVILVEELVDEWDSNPSGRLILRNLLIPQKSKTERNHENAEVRYTADTRPNSELAYMDGCGHCGDGHNFNPLLYL